MDEPFDPIKHLERSPEFGRPQFKSLPQDVQTQLQAVFDRYMEGTLKNDPKRWGPAAMEAVSVAYAMGRYSVASKVRAVLADDLNVSASKTIPSKADGEKA